MYYEMWLKWEEADDSDKLTVEALKGRKLVPRIKITRSWEPTAIGGILEYQKLGLKLHTGDDAESHKE